MFHLLIFMLGVFFFARLIQSTSQFAMAVLSKCVCVWVCVQIFVICAST